MPSRTEFLPGGGRWRGRPGCTGLLLALPLAVALGVVVAAVAVRAGCGVPPGVAALRAAEGVREHGGQVEGASADERPEDSTYLTFPEWFIVYSAQEYAGWVQAHPGSAFPYFRSVAQYWCGYHSVYQATRGRYPFNSGDHLMLVVIGTSYSAEYAVKGAYEHTAGWLTELIGGDQTEEDRFGRQVAQDYGAFLEHTPWYDFPFGSKLAALWGETGWWGANPLRKWERKLALSAEYGTKALYGWAIGRATETVYSAADEESLAVTESVPPAVLAQERRIQVVRQVDARTQLVRVPRYVAFRDVALLLARNGVRLLSVSGNDRIMVTALAPRDWRFTLPEGTALFEQEVLTEPGMKRVALGLPVPALSGTLVALERQGVRIEHIYDY